MKEGRKATCSIWKNLRMPEYLRMKIISPRKYGTGFQGKGFRAVYQFW